MARARVPQLALAPALLALAACAGSSAPGRAVPEPPRPLPESPAEGLIPGSRTVAFEYGAGSSQYRIESIAVVTLSADSIASATDSVQVAATAMIAISAGDFARAVAGTIYDSSLDEGSLIRQPGPVSRTTQPATVSFVGELTPGRTTLGIAPETGEPGEVGGGEACDAASASAWTLVGLVRDALPPIPDSVYVGAMWRDSVAIPLCRSDVHMVMSARHEYHLVELREDGDTTVALIRRQTMSRVDGAGTQSRLPVTVAGIGLGSSELQVDLTHGRVISHDVQSTLSLQHTAGERVVNMQQESTVTIRLDGLD